MTQEGWKLLILNAARNYDNGDMITEQQPFNGIIPFDKNVPHKVSIVICLKCLRRWVDVRPQSTRLVKLECETCGAGYVIETGEEPDL